MLLNISLIALKFRKIPDKVWFNAEKFVILHTKINVQTI